MNRPNQSGFTLYELLTTMLIVGVVLTLGVPNLLEFRQNSRMSAAANDLHSSFHTARTEASRSKSNVTICASNNSMSDNPTCAGEFEDGWIVFHDLNGDIAVDAGESIFRSFPAVNQDINITSSAGTADYFAFGPTGQGRGTVASVGSPPVDRLILCDGRGNAVAPGGRSSARMLIVTPLGRATVLSGKNQIDNQGGCP